MVKVSEAREGQPGTGVVSTIEVLNRDNLRAKVDRRRSKYPRQHADELVAILDKEAIELRLQLFEELRTVNREGTWLNEVSMAEGG